MKPDLYDDALAPTAAAAQDQARAAAERRAACITLAALALTAAGGNKRAAAGALRVTLQAIGAVPYRHGTGNYQWGKARHA